MEDKIKEYVLRKGVIKAVGIDPEGAGAESVAVELLGHGRFNVAYLVTVGEHQFVFRMNTYIPHEKTFKTKNEFRLMKLLEGTGIAPTASYIDESRKHFPGSILIREYIEGRELYRQDLNDDVLKRIALKYAALHKITFDKLGPFPPQGRVVFTLGGEIKEYLDKHDLDVLKQDKEAGEAVAAFLELIKHMNAVLAEHDERYKDIREFSLLKGDNKLENIIIDGQVVFIDWEFAKAGINVMDIVNFLSFADLDEAEKRLFLETYTAAYGEPVHEQELRIFALRDLALRAVWTLNKVSEQHKEGNRDAMMEQLELLKTKMPRISKYL